MRKFLKLIKLFHWLFSTYKIDANVLPRILVFYDTFDLLLPFVDRYMYFFVQHSYAEKMPQGCRGCGSKQIMQICTTASWFESMLARSCLIILLTKCLLSLYRDNEPRIICESIWCLCADKNQMEKYMILN